MNKKNAKGFTMIELIVVIAIIGILAAFAVPRFVNQVTAARMAALHGLAGALNSAVALVHAQYVAVGGGLVYMYGGTQPVLVNAAGFPVANVSGIGLAMQTMSGFTPTYTDGTVATFRLSTAASSTPCVVTYTTATGTVDTSGVTEANCS